MEFHRNPLNILTFHQSANIMIKNKHSCDSIVQMGYEIEKGNGVQIPARNGAVSIENLYRR